jgi:hypothetical protein
MMEALLPTETLIADRTVSEQRRSRWTEEEVSALYLWKEAQGPASSNHVSQRHPSRDL